jgi:hypothetical protein
VTCLNRAARERYALAFWNGPEAGRPSFFGFDAANLVLEHALDLVDVMSVSSSPSALAGPTRGASSQEFR